MEYEVFVVDATETPIERLTTMTKNKSKEKHKRRRIRKRKNNFC